MRRFSPGMLIAMAGLAGLGGVQPASAPGFINAQSSQGAQLDPGRPTPTAERSTIAKLRNLNFLRARPQRLTYKGVSMSVAQGKRVATKQRNRQRHKKQWKAHVR